MLDIKENNEKEEISFVTPTSGNGLVLNTQ